MDWDTDLANPMSTDYQNMEANLRHAIVDVAYEGTSVTMDHVQFFPNNVVAVFRLVFPTDFPLPLEPIRHKIINGMLGDLPMDDTSLLVIKGRSCADLPCGVNATCSDLQDGQYNCSCPPGFTQTGVTCEGLVYVFAQILLKGVFTDELANTSSVEYENYVTHVTTELEKAFDGNPNFYKVIVDDVRNGSIKVDFTVVYKSKTPTTKINEVREVALVLNEDSKDGFIEKLPLPDGRIAIQLREPPLSPTNISIGDVTDSQFLLQWAASAFYGEFSITFYVVSFHIVGDTSAIETVKVSASGNNALVSDLKSNTFYNAFVRGENKFGEGEDSEGIQVRTAKEDTDDQQTVIIAAVTVGVVVFVFAFFVGCLVARKRRHMKKRKKSAKSTRAVSVDGELSEMPRSFTNRPNPEDWQEASGSLRSLRDIPRYRHERYGPVAAGDTNTDIEV